VVMEPDFGVANLLLPLLGFKKVCLNLAIRMM